MKTIAALLAPQYSGAGSTLCACLKVTRRDGTVFAVTSADIEVVVDSVTYLAAHGLDISSLSSTSGLAVDNLEVKVIPEEGDDQLMLDIQTGLWDNAAFELFECNYLNPADGKNVLKRGTTGEAQLNQGQYSIEFRSLTQALQQPLGIVTQTQCRARFADYPTPVPDSRCRLLVAAWTVTGTLTGVTSLQQVTDSGRLEASDWFGDGSLKFTAGLNTGYERKVKTFAAGVFLFTEAFPYAIEIGDTYSAVAGCRKRHERTLDNPAGVSDCIDKFNNVLNFQGEPNLPGIDAITKAPETSV